MAAGSPEQGGSGFSKGTSGNPAGGPPGLSHIGGGAEARRARQMEFIRLILGGAKMSECAQMMNVAVPTIYNYARDPEVRQQLKELSRELFLQLDEDLLRATRTKLQLIDECSWLALGRMKEILQDRNAHISVVSKMIDSALDRTPELSRTKKLDVTERKLTYTGEDLLQAVQVMAEIETRDQERNARDVTPKEPTE